MTSTAPENEPLLQDPEDEEDAGSKEEWDTTHVVNIVLGAGIGSLMEFYSFGLVAYFQTGTVYYSLSHYVTVTIRVCHTRHPILALLPYHHHCS